MLLSLEGIGFENWLFVRLIFCNVFNLLSCGGMVLIRLFFDMFNEVRFVSLLSLGGSFLEKRFFVRMSFINIL